MVYFRQDFHCLLAELFYLVSSSLLQIELPTPALLLLRPFLLLLRRHACLLEHVGDVHEQLVSFLDHLLQLSCQLACFLHLLICLLQASVRCLSQVGDFWVTEDGRRSWTDSGWAADLVSLAELLLGGSTVGLEFHGVGEGSFHDSGGGVVGFVVFGDVAFEVVVGDEVLEVGSGLVLLVAFVLCVGGGSCFGFGRHGEEDLDGERVLMYVDREVFVGW